MIRAELLGTPRDSSGSVLRVLREVQCFVVVLCNLLDGTCFSMTIVNMHAKRGSEAQIDEIRLSGLLESAFGLCFGGGRPESAIIRAMAWDIGLRTRHRSD